MTGATVGGAVNAALNGGNPFLAGLIGGFSAGVLGGLMPPGFESPALQLASATAASHLGVFASGFAPGMSGGGGNFTPGLQLAQASGAGCDVCSDADTVWDILRVLWGLVQPNDAIAGDEERQIPLRFGVPRGFRIRLSRPTGSHILDRGHGTDWGVKGPANNQNIAKLQEALQAHMKNPNTQMIFGTLGYPPRPAIHFFNPQTGNVISTDFGGNVLRGSGFRLYPSQIQTLETTGWFR